MTGRLLIAVAVLAVGFGVLHVTIGVENFTTRRTTDGSKPIKETRSDGRVGAGIVVGDIEGAEGDAAIAVSGRGRFEMRSVIERTMPDGRTLFLPRYVLVARDSETVADDLIRLDDLLLTVFRIEEPTEPGREARAVPRGEVRAREAFVQVGRDELGHASIREDRDMDLFGVDLDGAVGTDAERRIRMQVARLQGRQTDQGLVFRTPSEREAFRVEFVDEPPVVLTGRGISGSIPAERDAGILTLDIRSDPVLRRGDARLRATGTMTYREDLATGAGRVELRDDVEIEGSEFGGDSGAPARARGDHLIATLVRDQAESTAGAGPGGVRWRDVTLVGSPAILDVPLAGAADAARTRLECGRLRLWSNAAGVPWAATADGSPVLTDGATRSRFRAARRIHVVEPARLLDSIHGAYGLRTPTVSRAAGRAFLFEGHTRIEDDLRGLTIESGEGLDLFLSADAARDADRSAVLATAIGRGAVALRSERDDLVVDGNDGFLLVQNGPRRALRLGPVDADPDHSFSIARRGGGRPLTLRGHGWCRLELEPDGAVSLRCVDPTGGAALSTTDGTLENLATLTVGLRPDETLAGLIATGRLARFRLRFGEERLAGEAQRVRSDGRSLFLDGDDGVELLRWRSTAEPERARGGRIDVHRVGDRASVHVLAFADGRPAEIEAVIPTAPADGAGDAPAPAGDLAEPARLRLTASRIDLEPSLLPPAVARWHRTPARPAAAWSGPTLLATGDVVLERRRADGSVDARAIGEELILLGERRRGLLRGDEASIVVDDGERSFTGHAGRIRFAAVDRERLAIALLPTGSGLPRLRIDSPEDANLDPALRRASIVCDGPIFLDGSDVAFAGPLRVRSLDPSGAIDPSGLDLSAADLVLDWDPRTRALRSVAARGGADVAMRGVRARGEEIAVDFDRNQLRVTGGGDRAATVDLGGGAVSAWLLLVDYEVRTVQAWYGRGSLGDLR